MRGEWAITGNKALINFSEKYYLTKDEVIESLGFRQVLENYLAHIAKREARSYKFIVSLLEEEDRGQLENKIIKLSKLLLIMNSKEISAEFPEFADVYDNRNKFRQFIEEVYTYWRNLERYALVYDNKINDGFLNASFIQAKKDFDNLIINFYRTISNNVSLFKPTVYRQVPAGANAGMILYDGIWPIPQGYQMLEDIPFIREVVLEAPFITYPRKNKRDGIFQELDYNPLTRCSLNTEHFFCMPVKVGELLGYIYVERDFLTHGISLANLFEIPEVTEISGRKPDLIIVFGAEDKGEKAFNGFYDDKDNDIIIGYVSHHEDHDYFGYMKKMILTIHNVHSINHKNLPIHGAMVHIELKNGDRANVVIVGDSGAGKSESIEAFRALADEYISGLIIVFDDMGTFRIKDGQVTGYGTEIGAFVRLDDLEAGFAFKELDRSIFMNPDKINARLITPVASYDEITEGLKIDALLYANNYIKLEDDENAIKIEKDPAHGKKMFVEGRRMAKGTTTESGITTSFFANPFGPHQRKDETMELIDYYFGELYEENIPVGTLFTQLGIEGLEKDGPKRAAKDLFDLIEEINKNRS